MKKCIAMLLLMALIFTSVPVSCYAKDGTDVVSAEALAVDDSDEDIDFTLSEYAKREEEDIIYQILEHTWQNNSSMSSWDFYLPVDGMIYFSNQGGSDSHWFSLDDMSDTESVSSASKLNGPISGGSHHLEVLGSYGTVSYTFYPKCRVYYIYENQSKELASYYLQKNTERLNLEMPEIKGYHVTGLYRDRDMTVKIEYVDKSVGKDWYVYPKLEPIVYSITYDLDGGVNASENPDSCTIEDGTISLAPATKKGYDFVRWYTLSSGRKTTVTAIDATQCKNVRVYAEWTKNNYTITYEDGYENQNPTIYQITDGTINLKKPGRPGYEFIGWYADSSYTEPVEMIDCNRAENITIYAKWEPIIYKVSYKLDGGINAKENGTEYTVENINEIASPTKEKYDFAGWYLDDEFKVPISEITETVGRDIILYAKWERHLYEITYIDGGIHENPTSYTTEDEKIALTDGSRAGYSFEGWYLDEEHTQRVEEVVTEKCADLTLYGAWKLNTYHVIYELDGGFNADRNITEFTVEDIYFTLLEPTKPYCVFSGWYTSPDFTADSKLERIQTDICRDLTLYAKWEEEGIIYQILEHTWQNNSSMSSWDFYLPVDGMIYFSNQGGSDSHWFSLDDMSAVESVSSASKLNGPISGGSHHLEVFGSYGTVSYTFYPKCRVYYVYENQSKELASYYLQKNTERLNLEMPEIKGYRAIELYRDRDMTIKIEYVDKSAGKDWYVYPKLEPIVYPVIYDMDGGTNNEKNIISYTIEDSDFVLQEPTKEGYVFEGWYDSPALKTKVTKIITSDCKKLTLYAKWRKVTKKPMLSQSQISMVIGESKSLFVSNATGNVTWNVKNSKTVKITERGNTGVDFIALFPGKTQITAKVNGVTLKCNVTVKKPTLKYKKITLKIGESKKNVIKGAILDSKTNVKWKSNNKKIATVKNGKIKAKKPGKVKMTATINGYKMNFTVIVKK